MNSVQNMKRDLHSIEKTEFDLLIIGGGITGAAVAYEAASRGLTVALFEKGDFGNATSAATSKMIHGGLRYLQKFEIGFVWESLRERKILANIAPNFVHPIPNLILSRDGDNVPSWFLRLGLILYDCLSVNHRTLVDKSKSLPGHRKINKSEVAACEPFVKRRGLRRGFIYTDCLNISPERMTLAFLKSAVKEGAKISNYAEVTEFVERDQPELRSFTGLKILDNLSGQEFFVSGKIIINCTGPWVDRVINLAGKGTGKNILKRSEGIHLVARNLVNRHVLAAKTSSGRHAFIVPWRNHSLIGTTDKEFTGDPEHYRVTKKAIIEFLSEINSVFGNDAPLLQEDILYAYGGLRPLTGSEYNDTYHSSRRYEIIDHASEGMNGFITVEGGKYTTSRNLAEKVVDLVEKKTGTKLKKSISREKPLSGCDLTNFEQFTESKARQYSDFQGGQIIYLAQNYGTEIDQLIGMAKENPEYGEILNADGEIIAQVIYAIRNEMALSLEDILFRRTGIGTLGSPELHVIEKVAGFAARELGWDQYRQKDEINRVLEKYNYPE